MTTETIPTTTRTTPTTTIKSLKPIQEIVRINLQRKEVCKPCSHVLNNAGCVIPGLDADYCQECRIYWINAYMRDLLLNKRRKISDFDDFSDFDD